jgi:membrane protein YdbS with pleckstrin-like domain
MDKRYYADKDSINSLRAIIFAAFVICIIALYLLFVWLHRSYPEYFRIDITTVPEVIIIALIALLTIIYVTIALFILPRWFDTARFSVTDEEISSCTGVIFRSERHMMMTSVQYVTAVSLFKWHGAVIHAAGGRMIILFLSENDCKDFITQTEGYLAAK